MKLFNIIKNTLVGFLFCWLFVSCDTTIKSQFEGYKKELYYIKPNIQSEGMDESQYTVDSICTIIFPDIITEIAINKISIKDGRIYILDTEVSKKLYIFDYKGEQKSIIGERGHSRAEFIGKPDDFFIDRTGRLHVFDKIGHKIIIFDKDGNFDNIIETNKYYPHSFGLTSDDRYMMYFSVGHKITNTKEQSSSSLILLNNDCKSYKTIMPSEGDLYCSVSSHTFFQDNERLSHIPPFSDSVFVFREDTMEKVVSFDFDGKNLLKENPELLKQDDDYSFMDAYPNVLGLRRYQETDFLIFLEYIYHNNASYWLYNKRTGLAISGPKLFEGVNPYSYYYFDGKQIIAFVDVKVIDACKPLLDNPVFQEHLKKSPQFIKDMLAGKINLPALVYFSFK